MGLIEEAQKTAVEWGEAARAAEGRQAKAKQAAFIAMIDKLTGGEVKVELGDVLTSSGREITYVRYGPGHSERSGWKPVKARIQTYLLDGEVLVSSIDWRQLDIRGQLAWVRRCLSCNTRWARTNLEVSTPYRRGEKATRGHLVKALAAAKGTAECDFCAAAREQSECPTCHRGWEQ